MAAVVEALRPNDPVGESNLVEREARLHAAVEQALAPQLATTRRLLEEVATTAETGGEHTRALIDSHAALAKNKALADRLAAAHRRLTEEEEAHGMCKRELEASQRVAAILRMRTHRSSSGDDARGGGGHGVSLPVPSVSAGAKECNGSDDVRARAAHAELAGELDAERALHAKASVSLDASRRELVALRNEFAQLQSSLADESHVADTNAYRSLGAQVMVAQHALAEGNRAARAAAAERDQARAEVARLAAEAEKVQLAQRGEQLAVRRLHDAQALLASRTSERDSLRAQLEHENFKTSAAASPEQFAAMSTALESAKAEAIRLKEGADEARKARVALRDTQALAEKATVAMHLALARVEELEATVVPQLSVDTAAAENAELRAACEAFVMASKCGRGSGGDIPLLSALDRLTTALALERPALPADVATELTRERRIADTARADSAESDVRTSAAQAASAELSSELEALAGEIESMSSLYETSQGQVAALTKQLDVKEMAVGDALVAQARDRSALTAAEDAARDARAEAVHAVETAELVREQAAVAERRLEEALTRAAEAEERLSELEARRLQEARSAEDAARKAEQARMTLTSVQKSAESSRAAIATAERHANEAQAAKEAAVAECTRLNRRLEKLRRVTESGGGAELIQEQLRWYKSQVKCNVVPAQDKEVVLSKCGHMYSRQAVDQLLQGRNRKCPSCGTRFDRADVLPIFFV